MLAIRWSLPWSFVGLGIGLPIFMLLRPSGSLLDRFLHSFAAAFGVMSALLVVLLAFDLARRRAVPLWLARRRPSRRSRCRCPCGFEDRPSRWRPPRLERFVPRDRHRAVDVAVLRLLRSRLGNLGGIVLGGAAIVVAAVFSLSQGISLTLELDRVDRADRNPRR